MKTIIKATLLLLALLLPATVLAHDFEVDGIYYNINGTTATVTSSPSPNDYFGEIVIPETVTYNGTTYPVTSIGYSAFHNCTDLMSIEMPNSITSIGAMAFEYCAGLTNVVISNSVTSIGGMAFYYCTSLTSIEIPNSVTFIGRDAFRSCSGLTSIKVATDNQYFDSRNNCNAIIMTASNSLIVGCQTTIIPNSVTAINDHAFEDCSGLTSIEIPNSVTSISGCAFYGCGLTSIEIPNSVSSIGIMVFSGCNSLTNIKVATDNQYYDSRDNCNAIIKSASNTLIAGCQTTVIPNSVTSIGDYAFLCCNGLTSVIIPNSVTSIGERVFESCTGLTSIEIPNSVTSIGAIAFAYCGLTSIKVADGNQYYDSRDNCNAIIETASNALIAGSHTTIIPNSVTTIDQCAFTGCSDLTSIEIPNSVTSIGAIAFAYCGLTSIEIPNSVTFIGYDAFFNCKALNDIYCYATTPPTFSSWSDYAATLHVPAESLEAYCTTSVWCNYENIVGDAVAPTGITISKDSVELHSGEQFVLTATVTPANASNTGSFWRSTNTAVATVDNGTVTAVGAGECDIIASRLGMQATCHVTVNTEPGDVNGDGKISIADVTKLIDYLLTDVNVANADVNNDGKVSIADVTEIIDSLLTSGK